VLAPFAYAVCTTPIVGNEGGEEGEGSEYDDEEESDEDVVVFVIVDDIVLRPFLLSFRPSDPPRISTSISLLMNQLTRLRIASPSRRDQLRRRRTPPTPPTPTLTKEPK